LTDALVVTCPYSLIIGARQVDAINNEKVKVEWSENEDVVYLVTTERT
jgi:hypothetical protein